MNRCLGGKCEMEALDMGNVSADNLTATLWSDVNTWPNKTLPKEGESVHIMPNMSVIFDLDESPVFKLLRVNGLLTFKEDKDNHLRAKHIFVRAGELRIGNETHPHEKNARITLHGEKDSDAIVYDNAIEAGNKVLANIGTVKMYGKNRP